MSTQENLIESVASKFKNSKKRQISTRLHSKVQYINPSAFDDEKEYELPETVWISPIILINSVRWDPDLLEEEKQYEEDLERQEKDERKKKGLKEPVKVEQHISERCKEIQFVIGQSLLFLINIAIQAAIVYFVESTTYDNALANLDGKKVDYIYCPYTGKQSPSRLLLWVSMTVSLTFILGDMIEGINVFSYILFTYDRKKGEQPHFTVAQDKKDEEKYYQYQGMTKGQKWLSYILVPLPMCIFSGYIGFWGQRFLLVSKSNGDLIQNMVCLMFICGIDEGIWQALVPQSFKNMRAKYPKVKYQSETFATVSLSFKSVILFILIAVASTVSLEYGCPL